MHCRVFFSILISHIIIPAALNAQVLDEIDYSDLNRRSDLQMVVQSSHSTSVMCTVYSPDGRFLASGGYDNTVKLWNVENGTMIRNFRGHDGIIKDAAFSPDGMRLATASMDGTVRLWGIDGSLEAVLDGHMFGATCVAFSPDGTLIASGGEDCTLKLWDESGNLLEDIELDYSPVLSLAFSPDTDRSRFLLASADDDYVKLWSSDGRLLRVLEDHSDDVKSVAFSPDGEFILSAGDDTSLKLWSREGDLLRSFTGHTGWVEEAVFSPDGRFIASAGMENVIKVWNTEGGLVRDIAVQQVLINCLSFRPDGRQLAAGSQDVQLWSPDGELERSLTGASSRIDALALSADGSRFATSDNTTVKIWGITGEPVRTLRAPGQLVSAYYSIAYSPDGRYLAGGGLYQGVKLWSTDGEYIRSFPESENRIQSIAFSRDGRLLAAGGDDMLKIWDVNGTLVRSLPGHEGWQNRLEQLAYSPDGRYLASCGNKTVRLMRPDGEQLRGWEAARSSLKCIAFSPDSRMIAVGGFDKKVKLYNLNGELLQEMSGHSNCVTAVFFSSDGTSLWSAGMDGRIIRWSIDGRLLSETSSLTGNVTGLSLTPEGRYVLYSTTNTVGVFDSRSAERYLLALSPKEWIIFSPDGFFDASKSGGELVSVVQGMTDYAVDQFAVGNNRPDLLLSRLNLQYADKDTRDLAALFSSVDGAYFNEVHVKTLLNRDVSPKSISEAGVFLRDAGVDDTFVLFIAGHGVHDTDPEASYYYLTHGADVNDLASTCAPFELIEELLHGIAPRRKLFLMDTCESGEVEPEVQQRYYSTARQAELAPRAVRGISLKADEAEQNSPGMPKTQQISKPRTYLHAKDRYISNDLLRRSGAIVFSSSKGGEFSYESDRIANGFFTNAIIRCLTDRSADRDWDGMISTDELRSFVSRAVAEATDDLQHPTVDRDNIYQKFGFPVMSR